ncbi:2'-5' RNA ligase family protein [Thalassiella azotivora]
MVQTVELVLDEGLDAMVRGEWAALLAAGLASQARHTGASNRPHVTMAVAAQLPEDLDAPLARAAARLPLPVRLGGLVVFGHRRVVLARLVVASRALLDLHAAVHEVTADCPGQGRLSAPGAWTPHVTLARNVRRDDVPRALDVLLPVTEREGAAVAARRWDGEARREWFVR